MNQPPYPAILGAVLRAAATGAPEPVIDRRWREDPRIVPVLKARGIFSLSGCAAPEWLAACDLVWDMQRRELARVVSGLVEAGVSPMVLKGGELVQRFFGARAVDVGGDLDLMVTRAAVDDAKAVLYALGYRQRVFDAAAMTLQPRDVADIGRIEAHHYELAPFLKAIDLPTDEALVSLARERGRGPLYPCEGGARLIIEIDLHHNVASDVAVEDLWDRAGPSVWAGAKTLSDADHLWINLSRQYIEYGAHGAVSLRLLAYTAPLVARGGIDWDVVIAEARRMELGPTLWYLLATLDRLIPSSVPANVLDDIHATGADTQRDWGWQIARPFAFRERFPDYAFA